MITYAILMNPGHNRVYFEESKALALAEFSIAARAFSTEWANPSVREIYGIDYLVFDVERFLDDPELHVLSCLSFVYAIFVLRDDNSFMPVERQFQPFLPEDISQIMRYTGKTNETFTRMLINVARYAGDLADAPDFTLLDPVAGKGTTLFEGLILGLNVAGIEIGTKVVSEAMGYFKKYLQEKHYPHTLNQLRISGDNKSFTAQTYDMDISRARHDDRPRHVRYVAGNSQHARAYFKKNSVHAIVGDLPYGVQHGSVTGEKQSVLTRDCAALLRACAPSWQEVLKPGGAIVLSYNSLITPRATLLTALQSAGFAPLTEGPYAQMEHRVDSSIRRDVVVGLKE